MLDISEIPPVKKENAIPIVSSPALLAAPFANSLNKCLNDIFSSLLLVSDLLKYGPNSFIRNQSFFPFIFTKI
jgi:hypothetical protein